MTIRIAEAEWNGALKEGVGRLQLGSGVFAGAYSFPSRFENGPGTNPEELIAAAHAGCFSMALAALLEKQGIRGVRIRTTAKVHLGFTAVGPTLTRIDIETEGEGAGLDQESFAQFAETAKLGCLVSRALAAVPDIRLKASLLAVTA
jgi:osmotically inducible protein OsmC